MPLATPNHGAARYMSGELLAPLARHFLALGRRFRAPQAAAESRVRSASPVEVGRSLVSAADAIDRVDGISYTDILASWTWCCQALTADDSDPRRSTARPPIYIAPSAGTVSADPPAGGDAQQRRRRRL
jgi:hypothetical protein